jgi:hypothetical protein
MTGDWSASEEYFEISDEDLRKYFTHSEKYSDNSDHVWPNKLSLGLQKYLGRTMILKNAFYSAAKNLGLNADHVNGWNYKITSNGSTVLVDLQQSGNDSCLRFPLNSDVKDKQKEFLLDFVKNLEEILKK